MAGAGHACAASTSGSSPLKLSTLQLELHSKVLELHSKWFGGERHGACAKQTCLRVSTKTTSNGCPLNGCPLENSGPAVPFECGKSVGFVAVVPNVLGLLLVGNGGVEFVRLSRVGPFDGLLQSRVPRV
eukprot:330026-Chlamydomonas_euryale.AAC.1